LQYKINSKSIMKYTIALFLTLFFALTAFSASADTLTVTNTNDSGVGSLRFMVANASKGDVIVFAPALAGQTINLQAGITIDKDLTIDGSGLSNWLTITCSSELALSRSQTNPLPVFNVVSLKFSGNNKGAVRATKVSKCRFDDNISTVTPCTANDVSDCVFLRNKAPNGGACGAIRIENCYFEGNEATLIGGAVYSGRVYNSEFRNNKANKGGAAGAGSYFNCTFINNTAEYGGAICYVEAENPQNCYSCFSVIQGCTFIKNTSTKGGAIYGDLMLSRIINACTFVENKATSEGGAIFINSKQIVSRCVTNNIFYKNEATIKGMDVSGDVLSFGGNVVSIAGGSSGWLPNDDKTGTVSNPLNAMLGDTVRCGRNVYYRLQAGSPSIGWGKDIRDTIYKEMCRDICGNPRPATCIDAGSYQQSTCAHTKLAGGCDPTSRHPLSAEGKGISLYPNPTTGRFTLHHSESQTGVLYLYDLTGRVIHTQGLTDQHTELNIENYPAGIYTLKVQLGNGVQVTKIVKE
jgi:predicted outer membrane repeat protein